MKGEASNLSEETDKGRIGFPRGIRGGMLGKISEGTWESLQEEATFTYKAKPKRRRDTYRQSDEPIVV